MRVLVTWGSKSGGTEGIAEILGAALEQEGVEVVLRPPDPAVDASGFDAVIVGGALYANRWHRAARRFVVRHEAELRRVPVWFFSSGPLDDSAERESLPPTRQVAVLMERVGAIGHATFGGRLASDAQGFPARAMAKTLGGDWRNPERIRAWAAELARALPSARPGVAIRHPARSWPRLLAHGVAGGALGAAVLLALLRTTRFGTAVLLHALALAVVFTPIAWHYFRARGAREALPTAFVFAAIVVLLDLVVVGLVQGRLDPVTSLAGSWLPFLLVFFVTWATGALLSTLPWPKDTGKRPAAHPGEAEHPHPAT